MTNVKPYLKVIEHPDLDEIIVKLTLNLPLSDIHEWLASKYPSEKKFVISEKLLKNFQDNYLDFYTKVRDDMSKTKHSMRNNAIEDLELSVKDSSAYKGKMLDIASQELDVRKMVSRLCVALETGFARIFDQMHDDPNIDLRSHRALNETADSLGRLLESYYKFTENPADVVIQHNINVQAIDSHVVLMQEAIRETLATLDVEKSLIFMELCHQKLSKLKPPQHENPMSSEAKLAEAQILNETISKRLAN